jgi:hypothetical protein
MPLNPLSIVSNGNWGVEMSHVFAIYPSDAYYNNESEGIIKISEHNSYTSRVWELKRAHIIR